MNSWLVVIFCISLAASAYLCVKGVLWWLVTGVGRWLFGRLDSADLTRLAVRGVFCAGVMVAVHAVLALLLLVDSLLVHWVYYGVALLAGCFLFCEMFSLCGLLRGDWSFRTPELRLFGLGAGRTLALIPLLILSLPFRGGRDETSRKDPMDDCYRHYGGYWGWVAAVEAANGRYK